jgi:hypothetical protein
MMFQHTRGLTFIETIIWVAVFSVAMASVSAAVRAVYHGNRYALEQAGAVTSAERGLQEIVRTIREGQYSNEGAFPIVSIGEHELTFYADIDEDPQIERVHYYYSSTTLMRGVLNPTGVPLAYTGVEVAEPIAQYVRNVSGGIPTFRYKDKLGASITDYANTTAVRFITVSLAVNILVETLPNQVVIDSSAAIRNLIGK